MKKNFFSILAFATLISFSVCTQSCSDDDDENAPGQQTQQKSSQEAAANIADGLLDYEAANESGFSTATNENLSKVKEQIKAVVNTGNPEYLNQVERFVVDATGLNESTINALFSDNTTGTIGISSIMNGISNEEKASLVANASEYLQGYKDGKDLAEAYNTLSTSDNTEEKQAALDLLEKNIKEHYQNSNDAIYKSTYVKATSIATGLGETIVRQVMDSEHPKEAAMIVFGIDLEGGQTADQATADAAEAAKILESLKGKTLGEIINNQSLLIQIGTFKEAYRNGSTEYKETFKKELQANGVSAALVGMFDSEEDVDIATIIALLGINL